MAEHKVAGGDYILKINDETVVCLTSVSSNDSVTVVDASSACGPDKSPGSLEISFSFEGQHLQDPATGKISGTDLRTFLRAESTISFEITPAIPKTGDEVQSGIGFLSELSSTYAFDNVGTFTGTIQVYGTPSISTYSFYIGQEILDGYIAYLDESGDHGFVIKQVGTPNIDRYEYGCNNFECGAYANEIGYATANTNTIVGADTTPTIAANHIRNTYGVEWQLPTQNEVIEALNNAGDLTAVFDLTGTGVNFIYLSSTETSDTTCSGVLLDVLTPGVFNVDPPNNYLKAQTENIFAIRYF